MQTATGPEQQLDHVYRIANGKSQIIPKATALGHEIHNAVFGGKSPRQALRDAENVILKQINGQRGVKG